MSRSLLLSILLASCLVLAACGGGAGGGGGGGGAGPVLGLGEPPTAILTVTNFLDAGPGSLRQAVEDAPSGAWVVFDGALPTGEVQLNSPLYVDKFLTIGGLSGTGGRHRLDGQDLTQIFLMEGGGLQLNDMRLRRGASSIGGCIEAYWGPVILWRTEISAGTAGEIGGAIYVEDGHLEVHDGFVVGNASGGHGGALGLRGSTCRIERTSFFSNQCAYDGGAIRAIGGLTTLVNCSLQSNWAMDAGHDGGAVSLYTDATTTPATLRMFNGTVTHNQAADVGGGIAVDSHDGVDATIELQRTIVALNTATSDRDLTYAGSVSASGSWNIVGVGVGLFFNGLDDNMVGDPVAPFDPMLLPPAALPDGRVACLPLPAGPAVDAVPAGMNPNPEGTPMVVDMRFQPRSLALPSDIGAIEL